MDIQSILPIVSPTTRKAATDLLLQFKIGQIIPATVIKTLPNNHQAELNIGGKLIQAQSNTPLQAGQLLKLQVVETGQLPQLKIVQSTAFETVRQNALFSNIGSQKSPVRLPKQLIAISKSPVESRALPTAVKSIAQNFLTTLPNIHELSNFQGVKQAISDSGIFLEAKLSQSAQQKLVPLENDLKTKLLQFAADVEQENQVNKNRVTHKPNGTPHTSGSETAAQLNRTLIESAKGAVSKLVLNQLSSLPDDHGDKQTWNLEIPFLNDKKAEAVKLTIQKEFSRRQKTEERPWSVTVEIDPPNLGCLQCKITTMGDKVSAYFRAETMSTQELIQNNLNLLENQLAKSGLQVNRLSSGMGIHAESPSNPIVSGLLDQHV